jgi:chromosome segregation ATPase
MEVDGNQSEPAAGLEEQIADLEDMLKAIKGKESNLAKAQRSDWEARLRQLKEQQKQNRPLPARLQAASDRLAKAAAYKDELEAKVQAAEETLQSLQKEHAEALAKFQEAEQEVEAVKLLAAEGPVANTVKDVMECAAAVLAARNVGGEEAKEFLSMLTQAHELARAGRQPAAAAAPPPTPQPEQPQRQQPPQQLQQQQQGQPAAASQVQQEPPPQVAGTAAGGPHAAGRPREDEAGAGKGRGSREKSSSRSPRGVPRKEQQPVAPGPVPVGLQ